MRSQAHPLRNGNTLRRTFHGIPRLMQAGLVLAAVGAAIDIGYHLATDAPGAGHGSIAFTGHMVTFVGMLVTMVGLMGAALTRNPAQSNPTPEGDK